MDKNKELEGLGGWLILVGIGVVLSPIRLLTTIIPMYQPNFGNGVWGALTTASSEIYNPPLASLIGGEIVFNACMVAASIYLIFLFFSKHYLFPKVYIVIAVIALIFIPLDAWVASLLVPEQPAFDPELAKDFARSLIVAVVWVPYLLRSKRVKATFVNKVINKQNQPTPEGAD